MKFWKWDLAWLLTLAVAAAYLLNIYLSTGIYDLSDGLAHFAIARYAPQHPELFLDHWGKPLFTLLAAPFAPFGIKGIMVMNTLIFVVTARFLVLLMQKFAIKAVWLAPLILALSPAWFQVTMGGLTEPLFACLLVAGLYFFAEEKYLMAVFILTWLPFARSEALLVLPFIMGGFLVHRQFRALIILAAAPVFLSFVGWVMLGDFLWIIHNNPYVGAAEIYGSGPFWHFWQNQYLVGGTQIKWLTVFGLVAFLALGWKDKNRLVLSIIILSLLSVFFAHSWFWATGRFGSYGLIRVLATVLPLMVLISFYGLSRVLQKMPSSAIAGIALAVALHQQNVLFYFLPIAKQADATEQAVQELAGWVKNSAYATNQNVWYMHPAIGYYLGIDNFNPVNSRQLWHLNPLVPSVQIREGGLIVYDSWHSPNEGHSDLESLVADTNLHLVKSINTPAQAEGKEPFVLHVFAKKSPPNRDTLILADLSVSRPILQNRMQRLGQDPSGKPFFVLQTVTSFQPVYTFWLADSAIWQSPQFALWLDAEEGVEVVLSTLLSNGNVHDQIWQAGDFELPEAPEGAVAFALGLRNPQPDVAVRLYGFGVYRVRN